MNDKPLTMTDIEVASAMDSVLESLYAISGMTSTYAEINEEVRAHFAEEIIPHIGTIARGAIGVIRAYADKQYPTAD